MQGVQRSRAKAAASQGSSAGPTPTPRLTTQPKSKGSGNNIGELKPVECTYDHCHERFDSIKEMNAHKKLRSKIPRQENEAIDHFYCRKCDLDSKDWEDDAQHKVTEMNNFWLDRRSFQQQGIGPKHIVCEFCGKDFESFGGRKLHRETMHPADQDLHCPGCNDPFSKAGSMIEHLEDGYCPEITALEFKASILHKHIGKLIMQDGPGAITEKLAANKMVNGKPKKPGQITDAENETKSSSATDREEYEDEDDEEEEEENQGGVGLLDREDPEQKQGFPAMEPNVDLLEHSPAPGSRSAVEQWPRLPSKDLTGLTKTMRTMSMTSSTPSIARTDSVVESDVTSRRGGLKVYTESYPSLNSPSEGASVADGDDSDFETTSQASTITTKSVRKPSAWTTGQTSQALFQGAKSTPTTTTAAGDWTAMTKQREEAILARDDSKDLFKSRFYDPSSDEWDSERFFHLMTETYLCPLPGCDGEKFETPEDIKRHFLDTHLNIQFSCKVCCKRFTSAKAQVSHMESASGRCRVKKSQYFKDYLDEITGGFLKARELDPPFVYNNDRAVVQANRQLATGVKNIEYKAKLPYQPQW